MSLRSIPCLTLTLCSAFEITVILFEWSRHNSASELANRDGPDFSVEGAVNAAVQFIPGVTAGLLAFLIFGTTRPFRKIYREHFIACFQRRRKRPSFEQRRDDVNVERGWRSLENRHAPGTYSCTVRGGNETDSIELSHSVAADKHMGSKGVHILQEHEVEALPGAEPQSPTWPLRKPGEPGRDSHALDGWAVQPWRTLGLDRDD